MHLFYTPDIEKTLELPEEEAKHCIRVLRLKEGDEITLTDGKGHFFKASISMITTKRCSVSILEKKQENQPWKGYIHLAMAPAKNMGRNEWFAEKATEIGLNELTFLNCRFSERKVIKTERIDKIIISAMKQSLKAQKPVLNSMIKFSDFVKQSFPGKKYIAHCYAGEKTYLPHLVTSGEEALILIGPEGDFSEEEVTEAIKQGFIPISLGKSRLRTETAALAACHILNIYNQE